MADTANGTALVYTDGGCIGNPGPGGYAALIVIGTEERVIKGRDPSTTNNILRPKWARHLQREPDQ